MLALMPAYPLLLFLIVIFISLHLPTSFSAFDKRYVNCSTQFHCANQGIGYPFFGPNRPTYCGHPGFELDCNSDAPKITIMSTSYRVLEINYGAQTLKISKTEYRNQDCPVNLFNTTLNHTLFNYTTNTQNLALYYNCPIISNPKAALPVTQFDCNNNGDISHYFVVQDFTNITSFVSNYLGQCNNSVIVPVFESAAQDLERNPSSENLIAAFDDGFGLRWVADNTLCDNCAKSGGQCGYNSTLSEFTCFCPDQPYATDCAARSGSLNKRNWRPKVAIGISASLVGIIVISIVMIFCLGREWLSGNVIVFWKKKQKDDRKIEEFMRSNGSIVPKQYRYSDIKKMTYSFKEKIGQGGYGTVYRGMLSDGCPVAVKVLSESKGNGEEFINEVESISRTSHVNIVNLLGFCIERNKRALIYEFMPNGSLDKFIYHEGSSSTSSQLEWEILFEIAVGIARGLEYLHRGCNTRILHFDIKPQNILLDEKFCPKISDFGLAKLCKRENSFVSVLGARGTAGYIAPEVFCRNFGGVSYKSDVYSYGMMVLEMVGGRKNVDVQASDSSEIYFPHWIYKHLEPGEDLKLQRVMSEEEEEMARKMILVSLWCIQTIPTDRPSMTKVVEMLEGSLQFLQVPPKPILCSPTRTPQQSSTLSSQLQCITKQEESWLLTE